MPETIPDLWPENIHIDVLTPLVILRTQEATLNKRTQGMLEAKVTTTATKELVQHQLDLIAPALNRYRETLLTVTHQPERVYPARIAGECFKPRPLDWPMSIDSPPGTRDAHNQEEFIELLRTVLRSPQVSAAIDSLIARSNEVEQGASEPASNPPLARPAQSDPTVAEER